MRSDAILERIPKEALPKISEATILGPFEWVQLTYDFLRVSPDGDFVLRLHGDGWRLIPETDAFRRISGHFSAADAVHPYSDVSIYAGGA